MRLSLLSLSRSLSHTHARAHTGRQRESHSESISCNSFATQQLKCGAAPLFETFASTGGVIFWVLDPFKQMLPGAPKNCHISPVTLLSAPVIGGRHDTHHPARAFIPNTIQSDVVSPGKRLCPVFLPKQQFVSVQRERYRNLLLSARLQQVFISYYIFHLEESYSFFWIRRETAVLIMRNTRSEHGR